MEEKEILYRGGEDKNPNFLWLSTSKQYASQYGKVVKYEIAISLLDKLCSEDVAYKHYVKEEVDEFPLYDTELMAIEQMKQDGYVGYYYLDDEYNCLNVCLFKDKI